mmetsp:Transcript_19215/g.29453  ORF Transcript_19215/g.29453 Transcript_19215/m.29453 type:complete len:89 (-) Transcript_19215:558-824(-)
MFKMKQTRKRHSRAHLSEEDQLYLNFKKAHDQQEAVFHRQMILAQARGQFEALLDLLEILENRRSPSNQYRFLESFFSPRQSLKSFLR